MEIVKILIVEDDIGFAYLVQHQLTNLGFQSQFILTVHTLEDARLAHLEFEIDVIVNELLPVSIVGKVNELTLRHVPAPITGVVETTPARFVY
jgi:hypothetical protein